MISKLLSYTNAAGIEGKLLLFYPVLMAFIKRNRFQDSEIVVQTSITLQIVYIGIVFIILLGQLKNQKISLIVSIIKSSPLSYFFAFILISFLSFIWSVNVLLTIYRSFEMLFFTWLIVAVMYNLFNRFYLDDIIKWLIFYAFWNLAFDTLGRFILTGNNPFTIPFIPSRLFFPLFTFIILWYSKKLSLKIITAAVIIFGISTKVFLGLSLGFVALLYSKSKLKALSIVLVVGLVFVLLSIDIQKLLLETIYYERDKISLEDSSGRDKIWGFLLAQGIERPVLGYGFASGEEYLLENSNFGGINAHNTFISAFVGTGILGVLLISIFIFKTIYRIVFVKLSMKNLKPVLVGTAILLLVVSNSAPGFGGRVYGAWIPNMVLLVFIIFASWFKTKLSYK